MKSKLSKYDCHGFFLFKDGDVLKKVCNAPMKPGVYLIYASKNNTETLVYIGKSGTLTSHVVFKNQLLNKRINNSQGKIPRQLYFENKIKELALSHIKIEWFVTFYGQKKHLPGYVEGLLIQEYFNKYKKLPDWNNGF